MVTIRERKVTKEEAIDALCLWRSKKHDPFSVVQVFILRGKYDGYLFGGITDYYDGVLLVPEHMYKPYGGYKQLLADIGGLIDLMPNGLD